MFFYILNILMVTVGIIIYFRNKMLDNKETIIKTNKLQAAVKGAI